jgi:peptidoglycan/LPS O-acetylase OafA/YrhL
MELIAAILVAGPLGYFVQSRTRVRGIAIYLVLWAVIFPIQTAVVHAENADDIEPLYFIVNALILAVGIGLNTLGARLRGRRRRTVSP